MFEKYDKQIIVLVSRQDKMIPHITTGRRLKVAGANLLTYEILNPMTKKPQKIQDIPTEYISSSGTIALITTDLEQYTPIAFKKIETNLVAATILTSEQKVWYEKGLKEAVLRTASSSWWDNNKILLITIIVMASLIIMLYIGLTQGNTLMGTLESLSKLNGAELEEIKAICNASAKGAISVIRPA